MTRYEHSRCELCDQTVSEDQGHILESEEASLLIHKACAMRLMKGVWDELLLRSTVAVGDTDRLQKGGDLLISHPERAPMGFVFFSDEDELSYTPLYASDLIGKSMVKKSSSEPTDVSETHGTSYIDEKYLEDYDRLHDEWEVAMTNLAETHGHKNPFHKGGE